MALVCFGTAVCCFGTLARRARWLWMKQRGLPSGLKRAGGRCLRRNEMASHASCQVCLTALFSLFICMRIWAPVVTSKGSVIREWSNTGVVCHCDGDPSSRGPDATLLASCGSLRHHRMTANYRYLASESYVPTHPTSPVWRGALAGRYGPSNIVPIPWAWCSGTVPACACTAFWAVLATPVHMIDGSLR